GEPPAGTGAQAATRPADERPAPRGGSGRRAEDERAAAGRRQEQQKRIDRAADLLAAAEAKLAKREEQGLEELIDARRKLLELQEELKAKERDPPGDARMDTLIAEQHVAEQELAQARAVVNEKDPRHARFLQEREAKLKTIRRELEQQATEKK